MNFCEFSLKTADKQDLFQVSKYIIIFKFCDDLNKWGLKINKKSTINVKTI